MGDLQQMHLEQLTSVHAHSDTSSKKLLEGIALEHFDGAVWGKEYLCFTQGERISRITQKPNAGITADAGWAFGVVQSTSQEGWFPPTYWAPVGKFAVMNLETREFLQKYGLDNSVGVALDMLSPSQRDDVMVPMRNFESLRSPTGMMMSKIYAAATTQQRVEMFIEVNDIDTAAAGELRGLSPSLQEQVMEHRLKMRGVHNPSGYLIGIIRRIQSSNGSRSLPPHHRCNPIQAAERATTDSSPLLQPTLLLHKASVDMASADSACKTRLGRNELTSIAVLAVKHAEVLEKHKETLESELRVAIDRVKCLEAELAVKSKACTGPPPPPPPPPPPAPQAVAPPPPPPPKNSEHGSVQVS